MRTTRPGRRMELRREGEIYVGSVGGILLECEEFATTHTRSSGKAVRVGGQDVSLRQKRRTATALGRKVTQQLLAVGCQ